MKVCFALTSFVMVAANRYEMDEDVPMVQVNEQYLEEAGMDNLEKKLHKMVVNAATGVSKVSDDTLDMLTEIDKNMQTILDNTLIEDQEHRDEMGNATLRVNKCVEDAIDAHEREGGINELADTQKTKGVDHVDCRKLEKEANGTMDDSCTFFTNFGAALKPPECACDIGANEPVPSEFDWLPNEPNPENEACLSKLASWASEKKAEFIQNELKCKTDTDNWAAQKKQCVKKQEDFELAWCDHSNLLQDTCITQASCWKDASEAHDLLCQQIAIAVKARKAKTFAAKKVMCYIKMLQDGHACTVADPMSTGCYKDYESCQGITVERDHLNIECEAYKSPMDCNKGNVLDPFLATERWTKMTYVDQDWYNEATTEAFRATCVLKAR